MVLLCCFVIFLIYFAGNDITNYFVPKDFCLNEKKMAFHICFFCFAGQF